MLMMNDDVDDGNDDDDDDYRDKEDGISPMMAAVGAGRLEVVRHLVNQHSHQEMRMIMMIMMMSMVMRLMRIRRKVKWPGIW